MITQTVIKKKWICKICNENYGEDKNDRGRGHGRFFLSSHRISAAVNIHFAKYHKNIIPIQGENYIVIRTMKMVKNKRRF